MKKKIETWNGLEGQQKTVTYPKNTLRLFWDEPDEEYGHKKYLLCCINLVSVDYIKRRKGFIIDHVTTGRDRYITADTKKECLLIARKKYPKARFCKFV